MLMKLKFTKNGNDEVVLLVDGELFTTEDYLRMVKCVKDDEQIELDDFDDDITQEEIGSIKKMINEINEIEFTDSSEEEEDDGNENY